MLYKDINKSNSHWKRCTNKCFVMLFEFITLNINIIISYTNFIIFLATKEDQSVHSKLKFRTSSNERASTGFLMSFPFKLNCN